MENLRQGFIDYGILPKPIVNRIFKKIRETKKKIDNNRMLSYIIEDFDSYIDLDGNSLQTLVPNYLEYKYKKIELIIQEVFNKDSDMEKILAVSNVMHKCQADAIENETYDIVNQSTEQLTQDFTDIAVKMSEAIGGGNINKSTAIFKWKMVSTFSMNITKKTMSKIIPVVQKSNAIISQNICVVCLSVALSKCGRCGTQNYCSRDCQKEHWKLHKYECKSK